MCYKTWSVFAGNQAHGSCIYLDFWIAGLQELEIEKVNEIMKSTLLLARIDQISGKKMHSDDK